MGGWGEVNAVTRCRKLQSSDQKSELEDKVDFEGILPIVNRRAAESESESPESWVFGRPESESWIFGKSGVGVGVGVKVY